jgi:leucyl aminopeptidase
MRTSTFLLAILSLLPALLQAAVRPEFAEPGTLPAYGVLALPVTDSLELPPSLGDERRQAISAALTAADFKAKEGTTLKLYALAGYDMVVLLGLGDEPPSATGLEDLGGRIAGAVGRGKHARASVLWNIATEIPFPTARIALGLQLGDYHFDRYKEVDEEQASKPDTRFVIFSENSGAAAEVWADRLAPIAEGVYFARDLISEPANVIYPESFVERTRAAFRGIRGVRIRVLDEGDMERLNMGALLGVGMGSERPPRLLLVEYNGGGDAAPLVFAGKGVTFDSGGISLKRSSGMWKMKYDMSGAAAVTGTVLTLARRSAPVNAVAVAALVENMPSQRAQRPGDVRKTGSGKTIEILNTDAEGRLILADAVWYAQEEYNPALLIDVATLTGSVRTALGTVYAGVLTRHDALAEQLVAAGAAANEEVWRLPLHQRFREAIKSDIADIKNTGGSGVGGGASVGAEVIGSFVDDEINWAHLDIAGKAWATKAEPTVPKGAVGWGVRLLNQLVLDYYEN